MRDCELFGIRRTRYVVLRSEFGRNPSSAPMRVRRASGVHRTRGQEVPPEYRDPEIWTDDPIHGDPWPDDGSVPDLPPCYLEPIPEKYLEPDSEDPQEDSSNNPSKKTIVG